MGSDPEPRDPYKPAKNGDANEQKDNTIQVGTHKGEVHLLFPQPTRTVKFTPDQAKAFAGNLLNMARRATNDEASEDESAPESDDQG